MQIRVLFFGMLKDVAGRPEDCAELAEGATVKTVFDHYAARFPRMGQMAGSIVVARNHEFAGPEVELRDGDEVAFLPPVSGGAGIYVQEIEENGNFFALTRGVMNTRRISERILRGDDGAVAAFEGVVRNNTNGRRTRCLEYECYEPMAIRLMAQIGREIAAGPGVGRVAMVHRLGRLLIGETSVAVIVTAPHRQPAFAAALEGINRLKRLVPIWKKEFFADGEVWVEGEWDRGVPVVKGDSH